MNLLIIYFCIWTINFKRDFFNVIAKLLIVQIGAFHAWTHSNSCFLNAGILISSTLFKSVLGIDLSNFPKEIFKLPKKHTSLILFCPIYLFIIGTVIGLIVCFLILPLYCMCFTRPCLPICKERTVVALNARIHNWLPDLLKHIILCFLFPSDKIKCELFTIPGVQYNNFIVDYFPYTSPLLVALFSCQLMASTSHVVAVCQRPNPHDDLHVLSLCWCCGGWTYVL